MAGFFLNAKKRKAPAAGGAKKKAKPAKVKKGNNDDYTSESDSDAEPPKPREEDQSADESDEETAQEKKLRLAKEYISQLQLEEEEKADAELGEKDAIAHRLQQDMLDDAGKLQKFIADKVQTPDPEQFKTLKGHKLSLTAVAVSSDGKYIFSASKDGAIIKWCLHYGLKLHKKVCSSEKKGHKGHILTLAVSPDDQHLVSAGQDSVIQVWNADTLEHKHKFTGHRNKVTALSFRLRTNDLFSASMDKTVKVWNLDEMSYVETLYGHEDGVLSIDSLHKNRATTCGGRDRTVRLWKIEEESQLAFQTSMGSSLECIKMLNEDYYLSGDNCGSLSIWFVRKKKPITHRTNAHTLGAECNSEDSPITAIASIPYTDLVASGSRDGFVRLWKCDKSYRALLQVHQVPVQGFINSLCFTSDASHLVVGVGQEHRLGRWWTDKQAKNHVLVIPLNQEVPDEEEEEVDK